MQASHSSVTPQEPAKELATEEAAPEVGKVTQL